MVHRENARGREEEEWTVMERGRDAAHVWSELSQHWMETTARETRMEPKVTGKTANIFYKCFV